MSSTAWCPRPRAQEPQNRARRFLPVRRHRLPRFRGRRAAGLLVTVEVWVDQDSFPADDEPDGAWDYDFLRREIGALVEGRRFNLQESVARDIYDLVARGAASPGSGVATRKPDIYPDCAGVGVELTSF